MKASQKAFEKQLFSTLPLNNKRAINRLFSKLFFSYVLLRNCLYCIQNIIKLSQILNPF